MGCGVESWLSWISIGDTMALKKELKKGQFPMFGDNKILFRDSGIFIHSSADGKLTISADGTGSDDINLAGTVSGNANWVTTGSISTTSTITGGNLTSIANITGGGFLLTSPTIYSASGAISLNTSFADMRVSTAILRMTYSAPVAGKYVVFSLTQADGSGSATIVLGSGCTWDGTNTTATFDAAGETLVVFGISATRFVLVENIGSVAFG